MKKEIEICRTSCRSIKFIVEGENDCEIQEKAYELARNHNFNHATEGLVEYEITGEKDAD